MGASCVTVGGLMIKSRSRKKSPLTWTLPLLAGALLSSATTAPAAPPTAAAPPPPAPPPASTAPARPTAATVSAASQVPGDAELHRRAIVIDTHADTTQAITYFGLDIARRSRISISTCPRSPRVGSTPSSSRSSSVRGGPAPKRTSRRP